MLVPEFFLGLTIGLGFWLWYKIQVYRLLGRIPPSLKSQSSEVTLPLIPRLRSEITSLKEQQEELQQDLQNYKNLLEMAPVGYLQVDEENQLLWCNQLAREMLYLQRWQPGQVRLLLELVRSYELDQVIEQTRDRQQSQIREWIFHPSVENAAAILEIKPLAVKATSFPLSQGKVAVFLENRQSLLELNQARDRALSDLAHELRTPLTSIRLVVENLQDRLKPPLDRWVSRLLNEVDRLIYLVQSWLELTRLENNPSLELNRQPVELRSLIAKVWETLEPLAQRHQIQLTYSGPEKLWINGDESRIYQIFLNLLDNSIKYSPPEGTIAVEAKIFCTDNSFSVKASTPPNLEINVIDSGAGFSEADLPHVFERFYRGDQARSRPQKAENISTTTIVGTGLGLAIVRQLVLAHGGTIKAMNHPVKGGAWIQIILPESVANY
ncbi:ATP-binding protein [Chlorogloeopsis sp. ULAP01]|uniref:sensor histidine kinase n=1 Tax=Chlorogloeopsis sp. ULAP01 TaxID=3056483 RepID=UPI0025AAAA4B|nr:ATP-binding protein [Chlorogloeopsis sp. ULAP01]MDM9383080.1 ATP-binding protein [Chlorogloeopsis sp. ULAP01]